MPLWESIYEESGDEATKTEQPPPPPPPVIGDTPGGPDDKAHKRKTRQEKNRNETKETKVG